jgi:hypothetical protein
MRERSPSPESDADRRQPRPTRPAAGDVSLPARAVALQRAAGNRATGRLLRRWMAHPDKNKKGVLLPDDAGAEYLRFNPPKNS